MNQVKLGEPYSNDPQSVKEQWKLARKNLRENQEAGIPVYLLFVGGDRKGSIARFVSEADPEFQGKKRYAPRFAYDYGQCVWDDRKNKIQWTLSGSYAVWLPDYSGPTVWEKFDVKAAKAKLLDNIKEEDIDGKRLFVGDKVLYINARYGGGAQLCHGTIDRFEAKADSRSHTVFTIVTEDGKDVESKIQYPGAFIWKK